jgi:hypothetical protein
LAIGALALIALGWVGWIARTIRNWYRTQRAGRRDGVHGAAADGESFTVQGSACAAALHMRSRTNGISVNL